MEPDNAHDKLEQLAKRIESATPQKALHNTQGKQSRAGYDLIATVLGSMVMGWLVDLGLGSSPWGLITMIPLGFVVAMVQVWRSLSKAVDSNPPSEDSGRK